MTDSYKIIEVPEDAAHAPEAMGTKPKFWYYDSSGIRWLFKRVRSRRWSRRA
jgi:hypothetical protein